MEFKPGQIVLADWRDAPPKEPNKLRPAIVVEDSELFGPSYPNVILVPLADEDELVIPELALPIEPTPENGCTKLCYALAHASRPIRSGGYGRPDPGFYRNSLRLSAATLALRSAWSEAGGAALAG
jgi:PemK-like, MazF-like toxin of type II toxin-antitoxin system